MSRVNHFDISGEEPDELIPFYERVFGWKFKNWDGPTEYWLIQTGDGNEAGINGGLSRRSEDSPPNVNTIGVNNIDEALKSIEDNGGKVVVSKNPIPEIGWLAYFEDPQGNLFGIMQSDMTVGFDLEPNIVTTVEKKPQLVVGMERVGKYQELVPGMFQEVFTFIGKNGLNPMGPPMFLCHEMTPEAVEEATKLKSARVEVAVPVDQKLEDEGEYRFFETSGGTFARIVHEGPYEKCEPAYEKIYDWLEEHDYSPIEPIREVYLNDPNVVGEESALTEILIQIE